MTSYRARILIVSSSISLGMVSELKVVGDFSTRRILPADLSFAPDAAVESI